MLRFMFITNDARLAKVIFDQGVERIFVDWEVNGKQQRQGHLDTVMSKHTYEDAKAVRQAVPEAEFLIRLNPFYEGTQDEVEKAISAGADLIMLPMFRTVEEVRSLSKMVNGRAGIVPLFETPEAMTCVEDVAGLEGIYEIYIGLNDLHLALGLDFIFEPLAKGMLDEAAYISKRAGLRFGFGGVARADEGAVSGSMVLGEHIRLKSDSVILSRTFYRPSEEEDAEAVFSREVKRLRECEMQLALRDSNQEKLDHEAFCQTVETVVAAKKEKNII